MAGGLPGAATAMRERAAMRDSLRGQTGSAGPETFDYARVPRIARFADLLDEARYTPVPDTWWIGLCDVVASTRAIEAGQYRAVNTAGAAAIAAVRNALPGIDVPAVFGGDGASVVVAPEHADTVAAALGATVAWVRETFVLELRAALVPVSAVRAAGRDLRLARYAASEDVDYAMASGGGLACAEALMKRGLHAVPAAAPGARPDLTGLTCRFAAVPAVGGLVLTLIVVPQPGADHLALRGALEAVLAAVEASPAMGRPLPAAGPGMRPPWADLSSEAGAAGPLAGSMALRWAWLFAGRTVSWVLFRTGLPLGPFSPRAYGRQLSANADFRKYDDGLRLTVACPSQTADAIEAGLRAAEGAGLLRYGLHRQDAAIVTCISPSPTRSDHIHFVDGAGGGYARAALRLKALAEASGEAAPP